MKRALISKIMKLSVPLLTILAVTGVLNNLLGTFHLGRFSLNLLGVGLLVCAWVSLKRDHVIRCVQICLYGALAIFTLSTLLNGGIRVPNYVGFFGVLVLASAFLSTRALWLIYLTFISLGALCLIYPLHDVEMIEFPPEHRYFLIYAVLGFVITLTLMFTRDSFNKAVAAVTESELLLSSVFQSIEDPLLIFDSQLNITYCNERAQRLDQLIQEELGTPLRDLSVFEMSSRTNKSLRALIDLDASEAETFKAHLSLNKRSSWFSISVSPHRLNDQESGSGAVVVIRDITEQQRRAQAQKMDAVGVLANGIAHDLNNMLGAIKSAHDLLALDLDAEHHDLLEVIDEATGRSAHLIQQLRLFSQSKDSKESIIELNDLITNVQGLLQTAIRHSHNIHIVHEPSPVLLRGVREQLQAMLMNLGLNGLQAMSKSGELSFQLSLVALDQREISRRLLELEAGSYICIEVRDGGIGISPDVQERIFEPFFTTRERRSRTGLGLSTVHGVIQRHHGAIEVESQVGVGTTMRVFLPHDETLSLSIDSHSSERERPNLSGLRVLIIDDEALIRQSLAAMLTSLKIDVSVAESGDEGLEMLRASIEAARDHRGNELGDDELESSDDQAITRAQYDLVILDMLMPDKSGHEVFLELITFAPHLPVILSSGYYPEGALEDMRARGLAGQLHKPYGLDEVSALIAQVLSQDLESER